MNDKDIVSNLFNVYIISMKNNKINPKRGMNSL